MFIKLKADTNVTMAPGDKPSERFAEGSVRKGGRNPVQSKVTVRPPKPGAIRRPNYKA